MQRESIERFVGAVWQNENEYYTQKLAAALIAGCSYEESFELVPTTPALHSDMWPAICRLHEIAVAWKPDEAHQWLQVAGKLLLSPDSNYSYAYVCGSVLGFLKAGIWLDENWEEPVEYNVQLLPTLSKIVCGSAKPYLDPRNLDDNGFVRELAEAIKIYLFPRKENTQRSKQVAQAVAYINQHGKEENFSCLDKLIIERLCHGLLANMLSTQKIAGIDFLLSNFGQVLKQVAGEF